MTAAKKSTARRSSAAPKKEEIEVEDAIVEEDAPEPEPKSAPSLPDKVTFVPQQHAKVQTASGANFILAPMVGLKMSREDAENLVDTGFGSIKE